MPTDEDNRDLDELMVYQEFYQLCVEYQRFVNKPLGLTCPDDEGLSVIKKVSPTIVYDNIMESMVVFEPVSVCKLAFKLVC